MIMASVMEPKHSPLTDQAVHYQPHATVYATILLQSSGTSLAVLPQSREQWVGL